MSKYTYGPDTKSDGVFVRDFKAGDRIYCPIGTVEVLAGPVLVGPDTYRAVAVVVESQDPDFAKNGDKWTLQGNLSRGAEYRMALPKHLI